MGKDSLGLMVSCEAVLRFLCRGVTAFLSGEVSLHFLAGPTVRTSLCLFVGWIFGLAL